MKSLVTMFVFAVTVVALGWAAPAGAQTKVTQPRAGAAGTWRLIGTVEAKRTADHDAIVVAGPFDDFRKIKLKVTDAALNIDRIIVTYDSGVPEKLDVRASIPKGGESRAIDLVGAGRRSIRKIEFWYDTKGFIGGKADVTVFGMK